MSGYDFPLFKFIVHFLGTFFLFSFSVPTQSVESSVFSFLANSGLLKKLSIHSVRPRPNKGSKSSSTTAAVLGVSGVIRLNCRTMFLPVYTRMHHKYSVLGSHNSKVFIPNFEAFSSMYCVIDRCPFQSVELSSMAMFWLVDTEFETSCSNDISQDKF